MTDHTDAVDALSARIVRAGGLADGTDPRALAAEYMQALKGHGWRRVAELSTVGDDLRRPPTEPTDDYRRARANVVRIAATRRTAEEANRG